MARPIEYDRAAVLDRAVDLFWRQGYTATSIDDLVAATGLKRGSLYQAFGNKAGLFEAAMDRYLENGAVKRLTDTADDRPVKAILADILDDLVAFGATDTSRRGCFLTNSAVELAAGGDRIAAKVVANLQSLEDVLAARLLADRRNGDLPAERDPRGLARFIVSSLQGLRVMSRVTGDEEALRDIADHILSALD